MTPDEIRQELEDEPWLVFWLEDDDEDVESVRVRFMVDQAIAIRTLRAREETVEVRAMRGELLTTAYASQKEGEL